MAAGAGLVLVAALIVVCGFCNAARNNLVLDDAPDVKWTRRTRWVYLSDGQVVPQRYYEPDDPCKTTFARQLRDIVARPTRIAMYLRLWLAVGVGAVLIVAGFGMAVIGIIVALR
jgi:hypothetical protein